MKSLDSIGGQRGEDEGGEQRVKTCTVCGQSFDTQNLDHVYHHGPEPHLPLPEKS